MLACGGGGDGRTSRDLAESRGILVAEALGGGIELPATLRLLDASSACLGAGLLEAARIPPTDGVTDLPLKSPIVIKMNSLVMPSSMYLSCKGREGSE